MELVLAWHIDADADIDRALMYDKAEEAARLGQGVERGNRILESWVLRSHGRMLGEAAGCVGQAQVSAEYLEELPDVVRQVEEATSARMHVGVGSEPSEAVIARKVADNRGGIVLYTPDLNAEAREADELSDEEADALDASVDDDGGTGGFDTGAAAAAAPAGGSGMAKAEKEKSKEKPPKCECGQAAQAGAGRDSNMWVCGNEGCRGYGQVLRPMKKAENQQEGGEATQVAQGKLSPNAAMPSAPPSPGPSSASVSPQDGQQPPQQGGGEPSDEDVLGAVGTVLQQFQQQLPFFEQQVKQANPQAYQTVLGMMKAMVAMAQSLAGGTAESTPPEGAKGVPMQKAEGCVNCGSTKGYDRTYIRCMDCKKSYRHLEKSEDDLDTLLKAEGDDDHLRKLYSKLSPKAREKIHEGLKVEAKRPTSTAKVAKRHMAIIASLRKWEPGSDDTRQPEQPPDPSKGGDPGDGGLWHIQYQHAPVPGGNPEARSYVTQRGGYTAAPNQFTQFRSRDVADALRFQVAKRHGRDPSAYSVHQGIGPTFKAEVDPSTGEASKVEMDPEHPRMSAYANDEMELRKLYDFARNAMLGKEQLDPSVALFREFVHGYHHERREHPHLDDHQAALTTMQHLHEDPQYYSKLGALEESGMLGDNGDGQNLEGDAPVYQRSLGKDEAHPTTRHNLNLPVGSRGVGAKARSVKVMEPVTGKATWHQVSVGQKLSGDAHALSPRVGECPSADSPERRAQQAGLVGQQSATKPGQTPEE